MGQIITNIFLTFSIYILISQSFSLIYYPTRFFHISHAIIFTYSAYFTYLFSKQLELSLFVAIPSAVLLATVIGVGCELLIYKPLRKKSNHPLLLLIASLGIYVILQNIISLIWGDDTKTIRSGEVKIGHEFMGAYITNIQITTIVVSIVLFIGIILLLNKTRLGRQMRAVSSNNKLSSIMGISSDWVILWAFIIGSALVSMAGILIAFDINMTPTMGFNWLLYGVVAMIISGVGSNWGLIGGSLLLATTQHLMAYYIGSQWMDAIAYIILILFLIWKPLGFSGKHLKKVEI